MPRGWYGVDFDGTLVTYEKWVSPLHVGEPIPRMINRVKQWLAEGKLVKIVTARVFPIGIEGYNESDTHYQTALAAKGVIFDWCLETFGQALEITCVKDYSMIELWDDRAVQVYKNTGYTLQERIEELERVMSFYAG